MAPGTQRKVFGGMRMSSEVANNGAATSTSGPETVVSSRRSLAC
jgi:hypothetical protein